LIACFDKFFHFLVDWDQYLSPVVSRTLHIAPHTFMLGVGVVEIVAGLVVAFMPIVGAWIVGLWLCGIIVNLLSIPGYFDIALRDLGLALGSFALARLAAQCDRRTRGAPDTIETEAPVGARDYSGLCCSGKIGGAARI